MTSRRFPRSARAVPLLVFALALAASSPARAATLDESAPRGNNYEFVAWKPERVVAFIVNKGFIYYTALASDAARRVPGILFTGEKDLEYRIEAITGLFAINRRAGALWALAQTIQPVAESKAPNSPTAWLPDARIARAWQAVVTGKPFEP